MSNNNTPKQSSPLDDEKQPLVPGSAERLEALEQRMESVLRLLEIQANAQAQINATSAATPIVGGKQFFANLTHD
jgi:hypothetical protein